MRSICVIDTSVFCEILNIPGKSNRSKEILSEFEVKIQQSESVMFPIAVIVETGNHIAHIGNGRRRRDYATKFVNTIRKLDQFNSPLSIISPIESPDVLEWLESFPNEATKGFGMGDVAIIHEFKRLCRLHPKRRVYIWSLDSHLSAYIQSG